jgi:hypothetical protein
MKYILVLTAVIVTPCFAQDAGSDQFSNQSVSQRNAEYQWSKQSNVDRPQTDVFGRETHSEPLTNAWGQEVPDRN